MGFHILGIERRFARLKIKEQRGAEFIDSCAWVMRIYRVDENVAADVEIDPYSGGWYIQVGRAGRYVLKWRCFRRKAKWISLLVSATLGAPYAGVSNCIDEEWRLTPEAEAQLNGALHDALELESTSSRGGSHRVSSLGSSRLRSSFGGVVGGSSGFMGGSGKLGGASGSVGEFAGGMAGSSEMLGASGAGGGRQLALPGIKRRACRRLGRFRRLRLDGRAFRGA